MNKVLGIDASNVQGGGGVTHLIELLRYANPQEFGFKKVIIWGGKSLMKLEGRTWMEKRYLCSGRVTAAHQAYWKLIVLPSVARRDCDLLFVPGGTFSDVGVPYVSMSQNMLIFEREERRRFPIGFTRLRYSCLRVAQSRSLKNSIGNIFISEYAKNVIERQIPALRSKPNAVVYHGVHRRFSPDFSSSHVEGHCDSPPIRLLYVSTVNHYKHQWVLCDAVTVLNRAGVRCELTLVGGAEPSALKKLARSLQGREGFIKYLGEVAYDSIHLLYKSADIFVFSSTCENMPNILVEAMSTGLPIACSSFGPMPEILGDGGVYFNPTSIDSTVDVLYQLIGSRKLRDKLAALSLCRSLVFNWEKCAWDTFSFFRSVLS